MEGPQKHLRPGQKWGASQEEGMRQTQAAGAEKKSDTTTPRLQDGLSCAVAEPLVHHHP